MSKVDRGNMTDNLVGQQINYRSKTGVSGVRYEEARNRYIVSWREYPTSKERTKVFSVSKFPDKEAAFECAVAYRKQMISAQIEKGAPYPNKE